MRPCALSPFSTRFPEPIGSAARYGHYRAKQRLKTDDFGSVAQLIEIHL